MVLLLLIIVAVLFPAVALSFILTPISALLFIILMRITNLTPWRVPSKDREIINLPQKENFHNSFKTTKCFKIATAFFLSIPSLFCFTNIISDFDNFVILILLSEALILTGMSFFLFSKRNRLKIQKQQSNS